MVIFIIAIWIRLSSNSVLYNDNLGIKLELFHSVKAASVYLTSAVVLTLLYYEYRVISYPQYCICWYFSTICAITHFVVIYTILSKKFSNSDQNVYNKNKSNQSSQVTQSVEHNHQHSDVQSWRDVVNTTFGYEQFMNHLGMYNICYNVNPSIY